MISYHTSVATNTGNTFSESVAQRGNKHFQISLTLERIQNETNSETVGELDFYQQIVLSYKRRKERKKDRGRIRKPQELADTVKTD